MSVPLFLTTHANLVHGVGGVRVIAPILFPVAIPPLDDWLIFERAGTGLRQNSANLMNQ